MRGCTQVSDHVRSDDPISQWVYDGQDDDDVVEQNEDREPKLLAGADEAMMERRKTKTIKNILGHNSVYIDKLHDRHDDAPTAGHELEEFLMHMQQHKERVASNVAHFKTGLIIDRLRMVSG